MSKILIVDDEPTIVELLEEHLRSEGYETLKAFSGEEALQMLEADVPDLVLLDLMLPGMDGYEVCRLMQKDARLNHIPVIMLTARSAVPNKVLGYERGADDYVVKPFDPDELSVRVRAQLHHLYHDRVSELTGLPGPARVEQAIQERLADTSRPWAIVYVDIDNLSVYNETYSFLEGDELLKLAGRALDRAVKEEGTKDDLVGHFGGDQFAVITVPERAQAIARMAERLFDDESKEYYSPTDRDQGYMVNISHQGMLSRASLCKLTFDTVTSAGD
ncbi:MAG: response regulator [Chloroflexia bacterium]